VSDQVDVTSAILLVGGFGTRLAPLTSQTPKPMLSVGGVPFTEHQIVKARAAGVKEIVLATSYLADVFEPYFGNGERFGIRIAYAVEEQALGTGGAIANAAKELQGSGPVIIFNGDVLSSHDLESQISLHKREGADITLHLTEVSDARAFGVVELNGTRVLTFNEKMENPPTNIINAGCYIFERSIIDSIPTDRVVSVERETFPSLLSQGSTLVGYLDSVYWLDIGTPAALLKANADLISGVAQSTAFDELITRGDFAISGNSLISRTAHLDPTSVVVGGSLVSEGVTVGAQAHIRSSFVSPGAKIGANSTLAESFVAPNTSIPRGFVAEGQYFGYSEEK
jgi:mannose-1-phosphate guanylyltransferase